MRVLFLLLAFAGALVFSTVTEAAPPGKGHLGARTTSNEIIAAVPANWPPQYSLDEDGNPSGFAIDVLNHLAKELNLTVRYKVAPNFVEAIRLLEAGEADLIPNSGIVSERKSNNLFTPPVETFRIVAFIREGDVVPTLISALHQKKVGVVERNVGLFLLRDRRDVELEIYPTGEKALLGLLSGAVDAVVYPDTVFQALARNIGVEDQIRITGTALKEIPRGLRFRNDRSDLHVLFSAAVASFVNSPDYKKIYKRWYGAPDPFWTTKRVFGGMLAILATLTVAFLVWRYFTLSSFNSQLRLSKLQLINLNETLETRVRNRTRELSEEVEERKRSQRDLETFFNQSQSLNLIVGFDGKILRLNDSWEDFLGYELKEFAERPFIEFVHPEDRTSTEDAFAALLAGEGIDGFENRYVCACGESKYLRWSARSDVDRQLIYAVAQNMTDQKTAENALKLTAKVFTHSDEGIIITDIKGTIVDVNEAFTDITGYERDEILGNNPSILSSGKHDADFYQTMWSKLRKDGVWQGEIWNKRKDGDVFAERLTISAIEDESGNTTNYIGLFVDITKMKAHERQLEHLARYDRLTGLPNRVLLADTMQQAMARARRHGHTLAIAFVDLDGFKAVNDTYGHAAGDELLVSVAHRLTKVLRTEDTLARIGGDEFVAIITDLPDEKSCVSTLNRILDAASKEFKLGAATASVSASIGVTFYPQTEEIDGDQLERQADQAMYEAKISGRNQYKFFDPEQDRRLTEYYAQVADAKKALKTDAFRLHYQPKIRLATKEVIGYEALIRWQHPEKGLLMPGAFLPPIERHPDVAIELGNWVLDNALEQIERWNEVGLDTTVSVNVSALQLTSSDFEETLNKHLQKHPAAEPCQLEIELLETDALSDIERVSKIIRNCRLSSVRFALDDFGTGYSSLAYLKQLPIDTLKIDQGFVHDSLNNAQDQELLKLIISLGRVYNIDVLAEGVETPAHAELLHTYGCRYAQGYAFARPMPADDVLDWHSNWFEHRLTQSAMPRALTGS
ncbi:EAL domain-containing protein [Labrenzia sp. R4_2]|uniref:EAL domain-containing protein n=1 Tax=Labrenzia sp. R4_2 TaxID=2821107 RepID=UPI001ADC525E|nr:EAL domain-containing protein [Labrenzia sp. R4_2]MBO9418341.1 EAL domain-containing protein [Labrenzia sp. R4_2]